MKRIIRIICLLLPAALLLSGCSVREAPQETSGPAVTLSALQYELENIAVDFSGMRYFREI